MSEPTESPVPSASVRIRALFDVMDTELAAINKGAGPCDDWTVEHLRKRLAEIREAVIASRPMSASVQDGELERLVHDLSDQRKGLIRAEDAEIILYHFIDRAAALRSRAALGTAMNDAGREDARLLDWVEAQGHSLMYYGPRRWDAGWGVQPTPRDALRIALHEQACGSIRPDDPGDGVVRCKRPSGHPTDFHWGWETPERDVTWPTPTAAVPSPSEAVESARAEFIEAGEFVLHSGGASRFRVDVNALSDATLAAAAEWLSLRLPPFGWVRGIPEGGMRFAAALERFATEGPTLIVDDVLTTGRSMEYDRANFGGEIGAVFLARGPCPEWVTPFLIMPEPPRRPSNVAAPTSEPVSAETPMTLDEAIDFIAAQAERAETEREPSDEAKRLFQILAHMAPSLAECEDIVRRILRSRAGDAMPVAWIDARNRELLEAGEPARVWPCRGVEATDDRPLIYGDRREDVTPSNARENSTTGETES